MDTNNSVISFKNNHFVTLLLSVIAIPLSMSMWIINIIYSKIVQDKDFDEPVVISPIRWLASCFIPLFICVYGYKKKSLNCSGALFAFLVGFVLTLANLCFFVDLLVFFVTSSKATKLKSNMKKKIEADFKEGGQRNWIQVLCNGGMATQLSLLYLLDVGASERPVDFIKDYRASWLSLGVVGVLACCNGDTWASELGTIFSKDDPVLITSWKKVPKGTNGGITLVGTVFSTIGGLVIGISHYLTNFYLSDASLWLYAPPQWPIILFGAFAGFFGSLVDSILGATLQYSGLDKTGKIVAHSNQAVKHISGKNILDNHSVNLISTIVMGLLLPTLSKILWVIF
ncbi:transmembrane protein 19 [Battus philenor]|uniref:transmembrane protein 19 n=1 Tax=Battus philenor TaxID=42288 RepID=UPI0035CECD55